MKKIYCISGLGSDEKIFARIRVDGYELVHIPWLIPEKNEPIDIYAKRMSKNITSEQPVLMGLSFGGMMCVEISKILPVEKLVLVSSIKSYKEMPGWMKGAGRLRLDKIIPLRPYRLLEPLENYNMGVSNAEDLEMVRRYRKNVQQDYLNWAVHQILNWKNDWQPEHLFHIHGDADRIFPIKKVQPTYTVNGGGHFMIYNQASLINESLKHIFHPGNDEASGTPVGQH